MTLTQRRAVLKNETTFPPPPLCVSNLTVNGAVVCLFVIISDMTAEEVIPGNIFHYYELRRLEHNINTATGLYV